MRLTRRHITVVSVSLAVSLLAGCLGDDQATKAGGDDGPVTLRIGTNDFPGKPNSDQIEEFARRVERLSDGGLRIKPVWHAAGGEHPQDQRVARMVTSGELEMTVTPSRAWDTEGVTSLRALNAPFLITSDELVAEVISGDLADELMSGLDEAGVVGLGLFPEGLRHPFGLKKPLLGPDDYAGKEIWAPTSNTASAVFQALGATTSEEGPDTRRQAGVESAYVLEPAGTATGNVTFYPKVNSLVINNDAYDELDENHRDILERAAAQTREWAIRKTPSDAEAASTFCNRGSAVVLASDADIAALVRAAQPVYAELERDEQTKQIIEAIRELKREKGVSATAPTACGAPQATVASENTGTRSSSSQVNGVYRYEVTDEDLRQAGVTDADDFANNHGVFTDTFKDGEYCWRQQGPNPEANGEDCWTYEIDGDRLTFIYPEGPDVYRWRKLANGDLKLTFVSSPSDEEVSAAFAIPVWTRIGDAE